MEFNISVQIIVVIQVNSTLNVTPKENWHYFDNYEFAALHALFNGHLD